MGNKRIHGQGAQEIMTDYERSKMLRVQENQERLRELGVKSIAKSLTSLAVAENTKKMQKKAKVTNDKDVEYNPENFVHSEGHYQEEFATRVTATKKLDRRQYIAPMSMNRYANLSKQRVSAPNISRVVPCVNGEKNGKNADANVEKRSQPRAGISMGELLLNKKGSLRNQPRAGITMGERNTLTTSISGPRRKLFSVDDEWGNIVRSQDVNEVDKEYDGTNDNENEEIENAIFESIHNGVEGDDVRTLDMSEDEILEDGLESDKHDENEHFISENNQNDMDSWNDSEDGSENEDEEDVELVKAQLDGANMRKEVISTSRKRGPTMMHSIHVRMSNARENITCNEYGQPVGPVTEEKDTVGKFSRFLGTIARTYSVAPLTCSSWRKVPNKDKIWEYVLEKYVVPVDAKSWVLKSIGACWRGYKV